MAWARQKTFNNVGEGGNAAGVCEAAVCLWLAYIQANVGGFNWGSSAGNYLPTTAQADVLYQQFDRGEPYLFRYISYLANNVYASCAGNGRPGDTNAPSGFGVTCSHYLGNLNRGNAVAWQNLIDDTMERGDALYLNLTNDHGDGHAIGVYKGSDYIWVFDPNSGLYRGNLTAGCCGSADTYQAGQYLQGVTGHWAVTMYFGIHMRAAA